MTKFHQDITGAKIYPGDKVAFVTMTCKHASGQVGTFLGWSEGGRLQIQIEPQYSWQRRVVTLQNDLIFKAAS